MKNWDGHVTHGRIVRQMRRTSTGGKRSTAYTQRRGDNKMQHMTTQAGNVTGGQGYTDLEMKQEVT